MKRIYACDTCGDDVIIYGDQKPEYASCDPCEVKYQMSLAIQYYGDANDWDAIAMEMAMKADGDDELIEYFKGKQ